MNKEVLVFIFFFLLSICTISKLELISQTPIKKWEFEKKANFFEKEYVYGYGVGVSIEGNTFANCHHNEQYPVLISIDSIGREVFNAEFKKPSLTDAVYKIRINADDIYKSTVYEKGEYYGVLNTWIDSSNTIYFPSDLYFNRTSFSFGGNSTFTNDQKNYHFFHSSIYSRFNISDRYFTRMQKEFVNEFLIVSIDLLNGNNSGQVTRTISTLKLNSLNINNVSIPKPLALRWQNDFGQGRNLINKKLGLMISADTVIPSLNSLTEVRTSGISNEDLTEKFDEVVDVNPYLVDNFAGKRLRWKGFTNSSFGFVALYENIDDNNRNILIRYNSATQTFTTIPLDASVDCRSLCIDSIGALAIVGTKNVSGNNDFYLGYFNSLGVLSEQSWGGDEYDRLNDCVFDTLGEIAVSGQKGNDLYLAKFTFNATSVSDKGANSVPSVFIHQGGSSTSNNELVVDNLPSGKTKITMYTMQGTFVGTIYEGMIQEGATYRFPLPSTSISSGVYLIILENNGITQTKQFIVVK